MTKRLFNIIILSSLIILAIYICFYKLGFSNFENWDEAWYGEVTKQMLRTKEFIIPYFNGGPFLDKPPLNFWLDSFWASLLGLSEFSVRLTSALSGFAAILIVLFYSYKKWGLLPALFSFSALALNNLYIWRSRTGNLDSLASLLILLIFLVIVGKHKWKYILLGILFGLTFLQKASLVYFPIALFGTYELLFIIMPLVRSFKAHKKEIVGLIKQYMSLAGIALLIVGSWLYAGYLKQGIGFVNYYLFRSDQGVADLRLNYFNVDYIRYTYYSLQRRLFFAFILGIISLVSVSIIQLLHHKKLLKLVKPNDPSVSFSTMLLGFGLFLIVSLTFTERGNNWYLIPAMPFWALIIAFAVKKVIDVTPKFIPKFITILILLIPGFYISYKTLTVNIASIIQMNSSIAEKTTAQKLKQLSRPSEPVMRLDQSYPVTIYYSDRKVFSTNDTDAGTMQTIVNNNIHLVAGKKNIINDLIKNNHLTGYTRYEVGEESIIHIIDF